MKKLTFILILFVVFCAYGFTQETEPKKLDDGVLYGNDFLAEIPVVPIKDLSESYLNKMIQVEGKISEVCKISGCWISLTDDEDTVFVITKHKFSLPTDCEGKYAVAQGIYFVKGAVIEEEEVHQEGIYESQCIKMQKREYKIEAYGIKIK